MKLILKLLEAQSNLAHQVPFMAPLVMSLQFQEDATIPTAATDVNCITYFNPKFIRARQVAEVGQVLYHEVLHLFLDYFGRRAHRDNTRWNIAHDLEISAIVEPKGCLIPETFQLPADKLGEWYYDHLPADAAPSSSLACSHGQIAKRQGDKSIPLSTLRLVTECAERVLGCGTAPGLRQRALEIVRPAHANDRLRKIQGALLTAGASDFSYARWNKRGGASNAVLPALVHHEARVIAILDVSGSMGNRTEKAAAILLGAVKCVGTGLDVIAWDTQVQTVCNVRTARDLAKINYSGGGTDMAAAIRYAHKRGRYDAMFVITDCDTPWPADAEARNLPPIYVLRVGTFGRVPPWMETIQAD